jgi:hypothetical protein
MPTGVVLTPPLFDIDLHLLRAVKDLAIQTFIAQLAIETPIIDIQVGHPC